jgi:hypothetical protein
LVRHHLRHDPLRADETGGQQMGRCLYFMAESEVNGGKRKQNGESEERPAVAVKFHR